MDRVMIETFLKYMESFNTWSCRDCVSLSESSEEG